MSNQTSTVWIELPFGLRMYVRVDVSIAAADLEALAGRIEDLRPVFREAANIMRKSFAENFAQGGRPEKWAPLSPNTIASKLGIESGAVYATAAGRRRVRRLSQLGARSPANILISGGQLRDSYATKNADHIERISKDGLEMGSKHWLAAIHEFGTNPYTIRPRFKRALAFRTANGRVMAKLVHHPGLPARPTAVYQDEDIEAILKVAQEHLEGSR